MFSVVKYKNVVEMNQKRGERVKEIVVKTLFAVNV